MLGLDAASCKLCRSSGDISNWAARAAQCGNTASTKFRAAGPTGAHRSTSQLLRRMSVSPLRRSRDGNVGPDRKSTRLNSSHLGISYAVFCLKKKKKNKHPNNKRK